MALLVPYTALWTTHVTRSRDKTLIHARGLSQDGASTPSWRRREEAGEFHADCVCLDDKSHLRHNQHGLWKANVEDMVLESGLFTSEILRSGDLVFLT